MLAAGAPGWLSIAAIHCGGPDCGVVDGTPPLGTTSFSYSVVATNSLSSTVAGPFTVSVSPPPPLPPGTSLGSWSVVQSALSTFNSPDKSSGTVTARLPAATAGGMTSWWR